MQTKNNLLPYYKKAITEIHNGLSAEQNNTIYNRVSECGTAVGFLGDRIVKANFCHNRLCPVCNYLKSMKQWAIIYNRVSELADNHKFIFITLTVKNCKPDALSDTITDMLNSFHRFVNRKQWKRVILGYVRGLEITFNAMSGEFHPHLHILCCVPDDYFCSADYITAETLTAWWQNSAQLKYHPDTDIKAVNDTAKGVAEVAKYALKMADILTVGAITSQRVHAVKILYQAVYNRRLIASAGLLRSPKIKNLDDINILDFNSIYDIKSEIEKQIVYYNYNGTDYNIKHFDQVR